MENRNSLVCESVDLENAWKLLSASKKRTFVAVQISPAVRVSIGEKFGLRRGEDAVGKLVAVLRALGADVVVDTAIVSDMLTLLRVKTLRERKESGSCAPVFSSECSAWSAYAKEMYPEIAEELLPTSTSVCAKLLKHHYAKQAQDKKVRVIALEMGAAKKKDSGVDVVLTLDELSQLIDASCLNVRLLKKQALDIPFGVGSGAAYLAAASGGDAESVARALACDKTPDALRKLEYSDLYAKKDCREESFEFGGKAWSFAVADTLQGAQTVLSALKDGEACYDYVEITACAGGCIAKDCDLSEEEGEMTRRLRKLGLKYLDFGHAARSADASSAAERLLKTWNALVRSGEAAALDVIDEIVDDPEEVEEIIEDVVEEIVEETVEEAIEAAQTEAIEEVKEEIVEEILEEIGEVLPKESLAEIVEEAVEEAMDEAVEEAKEDIIDEVAEEIVENVLECECPCEKSVEEIVEETIEEVVEDTVEEIAENIAEETIEEVIADVVEAVIEEEMLSEETVEEVIEEPEVIEEVTEEVIEEPEVIEEVAEEVIEEPEVVEEVTEEIIEEPEVVEEVTEEVIEEPEVIEEVTEEVIEEPETVEEVVTEEVAVAEDVVEEPAVEEVAEDVVDEVAPVEEIVEEVTEEVVEDATEKIVEEPAEEVVEEVVTLVEETVSEAEVQEEIAHVEELLGVAEEDLTPAQKLARAIYYRRLSTRDRRKLKRLKRKNK